MEPETTENEQKRHLAAVDSLRQHGFRPLGGWRFYKDGKTYDLSAADLSKIESIERNGSFVERLFRVASLLPKMDCEKCLYRSEQWRDGGHCYMFRDKPEGTHCGQFRKK